MDEKHLQYLLEKFLSSTANDLEKKELNEWYEGQNNKDVIWADTSAGEEQNIEDNMLRHIQNHVRQNRTTVFRLPGKFLSQVAAIVVGVSLLAGLYFYNNSKKDNVAAQKTLSIVAPVKYAENKYVLLPDSSKVLLHPGSTIQYHFNGKIRELTLLGEAYFDIKHIDDQPFVIHTGKVITTVLGTAFVIKAYKGQPVSVLVTRGRVSVANDKTMLAVLTPGQQVRYDIITQVANQQNFKIKSAVTWVKADMQFDAMPFAQLAEKLSRRYDVVFHFNNPALEKCLITGRFDGTESLKEVLHTISETMTTTCTINGSTVNIDGAGCGQ